MAYVTDDEAEKIAGYRQTQADLTKAAQNMGPFQPEPDPFANWQDTVDFAPPAVYGPFQPSPAPQPSYSLTGQGFDDFNVGNQMGPFEPYDLGFERRGQQAPVLFQPEPEPFYDPRGAAFQASQRSQSNPFLEDFGASLQETGNLFADRTQRLPGLVEGLGGMFGFGGRAGGLPETEQLGEIYQKDILPNVSGNEFIRSFTPYEPENLPGPLPYLTDALAPINFATAGIASEVPVLGAMFKGPYLANLGAEMGIDIGARFGAEQAAGERGASVPLFGEQPAWLRGLEGGLLGGLGAAGAIKGADAGIPALGRYLDEPIEVAPGQFVSRGEFGGGKFGPVEGEPPKLTADAGPVMPTVAQPAVDVPFPGQRAILDALQEQIRFRESGEAEALIRAGRATQAAGIGDALAKGGSLDEVIRGASSGMRVGSMLGEGKPLNLADDAVQAATKEIVDAGLASGRNFDTYGTLKALKKLQDGEWLQPGEIKKLGKVFGSDVEDAIRKTNAGRIKITADLTPEDVTRIDRLAEVEGKKAARAEIEAQAQHRLADDLAKRARMDPTNKRLASAVDDARARALKLEADAERFQVERIEKMEAQARAKTQRAETAANREEVRQAEMRDKRELKDTATRDYKESGQKALDSALALIEKSDLPPKAKAAASEFVEQMVKADGAILDTMKGEAPGFLRTVYAGATGEVSDSWVSALVEQRSIASGVLQDIGFDRKTANAIAKALSEMEVTRRWGPEPPPHIVKSLEQAKQKWADDSAIAGAASISQEWKNLMFGLFDIGIAGIQGLAAGTQGAAAILAGIVNRTLNVRALGVDTSPGNLAKRVQYGLDGRVRGGATLTGATDSSSGTLLRHIPGLKTVDQKVVSRAIGTMNDLQFRHAMGFLGDLIHEGQLVMLKLTGSDITDPLVRRRSADWANAISSAGKLAQRPGRALTERGFILSPSMVRSQSQVLGGMARILGPTTARETRILAATTVVSYGAVLLAIGKYLNDAIGTDDFEFDPSKPGFGRIRLENGTIISPFPQTQLARLLARSVRVLAEEGNGEQDPKMLGKAWTNFGIGRLSPAASMGAAAAGVGFDPDIGWRYGDLNEGKSWWEQAIENLAPTPPMVESLAREGFDPLDTSLEAVGLSNFKESEYAARDRALKADPRFQGRGWAKLEDWEKAIVNAEGGRVYSRDPQIKAQQERADVIAGDAKAYQEKIDQWQLRGEKPDGTPYTVDDWKRDRAKNDRFVAGRYEELYAGVDWKKDDLNPVDLYYKAIADAVDPQTDEVNWDKVDAWKATLSEEDRAYIERNTNLRDTVLEQQWRRDVKLLGDSGYFDTENKVAVRKADPEIAAAVRRWGYSEMSVKAEDTVMRYTAQQEVDDRSLAQGAITPEQWRENYNTRRDQLRAEKDGIYAGMKDDGVSTDPIDAYFKEIEKAVAPNGQDIDWQQVDAWVAQQPADVQSAINSYAAPGLTPVVDQYRADVKKIVESQYWDVSDRVTQYWAKANGFDWTEGTDADKFWGDIQQEVYQRVQAKGLAPLEARSLTNVVMGQLQKDYVDVSSKVRAALRDSNPELARLLVQWGYWEPSKSDTGELIAAGTLR